MQEETTEKKDAELERWRQLFGEPPPPHIPDEQLGFHELLARHPGAKVHTSGILSSTSLWDVIGRKNPPPG